jgi:hypothetical protein
MEETQMPSQGSTGKAEPLATMPFATPPTYIQVELISKPFLLLYTKKMFF